MRNGRFQLKIERDPVITTSDGEGVPVPGTIVTTTIPGNLSMLSSREIYRAAHSGESVEAAASFFPDTDVIDTDRIVLDTALNPNAPVLLCGTWLVSSVRYDRSRVRVLLRREDL